jgi:hypothetical protein
MKTYAHLFPRTRLALQQYDLTPGPHHEERVVKIFLDEAPADAKKTPQTIETVRRVVASWDS